MQNENENENEIKTVILPPEQWGLVAPYVEKLFENGMPDNPLSTSFLAAFRGNQLVGFVHMEELIHLNSIWTNDDENNPALALRLIREVDSLVPKGFSAIALMDNELKSPKVTELLKKRFGARRLGLCEVLRKDY